jgi:hypothetical protein
MIWASTPADTERHKVITHLRARPVLFRSAGAASRMSCQTRQQTGSIAKKICTDVDQESGH